MVTGERSDFHKRKGMDEQYKKIEFWSSHKEIWQNKEIDQCHQYQNNHGIIEISDAMLRMVDIFSTEFAPPRAFC